MAPPAIVLKDTNGKWLAPHTFANGQKAAVLFFVLADCPNANKYAPEMKRIANAYTSKGVKFYLVFEDPILTAKAADKHVKDFGIPFPALLDPDHRLAKRMSATISPEAFVIRPMQQVAYRGRINNLFPALGQQRRSPTTHELRDALDDLLANRRIRTEKTTAVGCILPK